MVNYIGLPSLQYMEESIEIVFNDLEGKISYKPMSVKGNRKLKSIQTTLARSNSLDVHLFIFPSKLRSIFLFYFLQMPQFFHFDEYGFQTIFRKTVYLTTNAC
jgi:hypothetical protein